MRYGTIRTIADKTAFSINFLGLWIVIVVQIYGLFVSIWGQYNGRVFSGYKRCYNIKKAFGSSQKLSYDIFCLYRLYSVKGSLCKIRSIWTLLSSYILCQSFFSIHWTERNQVISFRYSKVPFFKSV